MISLSTEKDLWNHNISKMDSRMISEIISLSQHWIQIKTLERNNVVVYEGRPFDPEFEAKMRGVAEFLFDLNKKIWQ